jgi:beta-N-acetylhexosaminidase
LRWCVLATWLALLGACHASADGSLRSLTLRQKLAQLVIVRFVGPAYIDDLDVMIRRQGVGGVTLYAIDGNIVDKGQVRALTARMHRESTVPLVVAIDQEGGRVDRLVAIRGPRPSAAAIAERGDPALAEAEGTADARHLAHLGIELNLAPVVDVTQIYNWQLEKRTYGYTPEPVIRMAGAYLNGLQASGRVVGTLKHFPGLGAVSEDPHRAVPHLAARREDLENFDWVPYRALIRRGDVAAIMVTHMFLDAIDPSRPASLSAAVVTGILRDDLQFHGVVIADALTMRGVATDESLGDVALQALVAGSDWLMGARTADDVEAILTRLERAITDGTLSVERVDASVRRILALKDRVGLLAGDGAAKQSP